MISNFEFLGKTFSAYMFLALAGIFTVLYFTYALARKSGLDEFNMLSMMLLSFIGVVLGGHILYGITNLEKLAYLILHINELQSVKDLFENIVVIFGGSVFYGGLIGAMLVSYIYIRKKHLNIGPYSDIGALAIPLFHTFGRIGCFLSGCCYGIEWKYGIVYHHAIIESANDVERFPVQLVEASLNLILFFVMFKLFKSGRCQNRILSIYLLIYPVYRFMLEFLRGDKYRGAIGVFSTSQIISIIIILATISYLIFIRIKTSKLTA